MHSTHTNGLKKDRKKRRLFTQKGATSAARSNPDRFAGETGVQDKHEHVQTDWRLLGLSASAAVIPAATGTKASQAANLLQLRAIETMDGRPHLAVPATKLEKNKQPLKTSHSRCAKSR